MIFHFLKINVFSLKNALTMPEGKSMLAFGYDQHQITMIGQIGIKSKAILPNYITSKLK